MRGAKFVGLLQTIGDKPSDIGFGIALETRTALIRSKYWSQHDLCLEPTIIVDSLYDAAKEIISTSQNVENR